MERFFKRMPNLLKFGCGTLVVYFGIRVFWTDYVEFHMRLAGLVVALCGLLLALHDSEE